MYFINPSNSFEMRPKPGRSLSEFLAVEPIHDHGETNLFFKVSMPIRVPNDP